MRVCNVGDHRSGSRSASLGRNDSYQMSGSTVTREVGFWINDLEGFANVSKGKRFPFQISDVRTNTGEPIPMAPVMGVALSEDPWANGLSPLRISIQVPSNYAPGDFPVSATLTLYGTNGGVTYPIFENRRLSFLVKSPMEPLNLKAIYDAIVKKNQAVADEKYAAEQAALDQQMYQSYQDGLATEAQAAAAAEAARLAAEQAATSKAAADKAARDAEDARAAAAGEISSRNKTIMWAVGGLTALGLISYFAFAPSGK